MKKLLSLLFLLSFLFSNAQFDTEHWFAPMSSRAGTNNYEGYVYLSTSEIIPFTVTIYNNNAVYTTATISKGNPAQVIIPVDFMCASTQPELFTVSTKGLYLKGTKKFYANYRFGVTNHAEIITSKGYAGIGTTFYAAMAKNTASPGYLNSTIGVLATEDNTTVTISGYDPNIYFSDGVNPPSRTFTLNKGQSYILDVMPQDSPANLDGLIGAKIVANKAISVTNGNFNAIYTNFNFINTDVLMDQAVPVDRLGKEFVIVKGNGPTSSGMETVLIVATENGTTYSVNGTAAGVTLNEGDYALIPGSSYVNQGNSHYNMNVVSNKNVYIYQLLAGTSSGNVYATGGFNYIPPLSCFLPNKIDEIGIINQIGNTYYDTKLNIITQTGAAVTVNGATPAAANGPYPVTGNTNWVTYSIPNISGNITVNSTKSITAGISAGSGAVGYGGYFAGFSSVPAITKTGNCYNGVLLQVDNTFDSYQWYLNGVIIPGATTNSINPELYGAGSYTVFVTKNNCDSKLTLPYTYTLCPPITTATYNIGSCNTQIITPAFTNSTQTINPALTQILGPPTNGTATVNPVTGQITYTPNAGLTIDTSDQFIYYIEGNGTPASFEYFKVIINIDVLQTNNATINSCADANGIATYNLTSVSVTPDAGTTVNYFSNAALTTPIATPTNYSSSAGTVYANVTSQYGCTKSATITLTTTPSPNINITNFNGALCDTNFDGIVNVDFTTITPQIVTNSGAFNVRYYLVQADAIAGNANNLAQNWSYNTPTTVYVRVDGATGNCPPVFGQLNFTIGNKLSLISTEVTKIVCDPDGNGSEVINLANFLNFFITTPVSAAYYGTLANAQTSTNALPASQLVTGSGTFYIRFESSSACPNIGKLNINLGTITVTPANLISCSSPNNTGTFNLTSANVTTTAGTTITYFTDAALTNQIVNPTTYTSGPATVYANVTSDNGCSSSTTITLSLHPLANINTANYNSAICDDNFDGIANVNFSTVTPQIVNNSASFNVRYYLVQADAIAGNNNTLPANWTFTATTTVYVRVDNLVGNCPPVFGQINFMIGSKIFLTTGAAHAEICDSDLSGSETVNLNDYKNLFTADPLVTLSFFTTLADAQTNVSPISSTQIITTTQTFYIRFESPNHCPNTGKLTLTLKSPKKSTILKDESVCPGEKILLDAGPGFTSYLWSNGATTPSIIAGAGSFYVDLGFNGCIYRQHVIVKTKQLPAITSITVNGNTATINVSGGTPPYQYSLDGFNWQSSNVFTDLKKGKHKAYVISAENCGAVIKEFLVLNLVNIITPNGDGINDVLDLRDLAIMDRVLIEIYDRYGALVFKPKGKDYVWDGKIGGRPLSTGSYWYILKWTDPESGENYKYEGWILIKNRE